MRRIPMHEPWPFHENYSPIAFDKEFTDRDRLPDELPNESEPGVFEDAASPIVEVDTVDEEVGGDPPPDEEIPDTGTPLPTPEEQRAKLDEEIFMLRIKRDILKEEFEDAAQFISITFARNRELGELIAKTTSEDEIKRLSAEKSANNREIGVRTRPAREIQAEDRGLIEKIQDLIARREAIK